MKKAVLALAVLLALAGCGNTTVTTTSGGTTTTTTTPNNPLASISAFTAADLANAIAVATAAGPTGVPVVTCFTYLQTQLAALQAASQQPTGSIGVATTFTVGFLALNNINSIISPTAQTAYATACGPLITLTMNQGLTLQAQVAALAALIAK